MKPGLCRKDYSTVLGQKKRWSFQVHKVPTKEELGFRAKTLAQRQRNCSSSVSVSWQTKKTWAEMASHVVGGNDTMEITQVCSEGREEPCLTLCGSSSCPDQSRQFCYTVSCCQKFRSFKKPLIALTCLLSWMDPTALLQFLAHCLH